MPSWQRSAPPGVPDPIVPTDGTQNITGALTVSGAINAGTFVAAASELALTNSGADIIAAALGGLTIRDDTPTARLSINETGIGFYQNAPVAKAGAVATPTAPSAVYVQAEATAMKTAVDAIRTALTNIGITA